MRPRYIIIAGTLTAALAVSGIFVACSKEMSHGSKTAAAKPSQGKKYTCPMHPDYITDKPGDCPVCGMTLVPVEETPAPVQGQGHEGMQGMDHAPAPAVEGYAPVPVTAEQRQSLGVTTAQVALRDMEKTVRTNGTVAYDPDLYAAQQEYLSARAAVKALPSDGGGRQLVQAAETRLKLLGLDEAQIAAVAKRGSPDESLLLPDAKKGFWVYAAVYENDLPWVEPGQAASISLSGAAGNTVQGTVRTVSPVLEQETRSAKARIRASGGGAALRPGAYVSVEMQVPLGSYPAVPSAAVMDTGERKIVFVDSGSVLEPREVKTVAEADGYTAIESGLSEGETVVTNANFLIDSESRLKGTMSSRAGGHAGHEGHAQ